MEAKALKTSFWPEMTQHAVVDDVWGANVVNGVSGDDFFVDELLNFSKEEEGFLQEDEEDCGGGGGGLGDDEKDSGSVSSHEEDHSLSNGFSLKHDFDSLPTSELSVPTDDLADLEWLSHFVDDSFTEFSLPQPTPIKPQPQTGSGPPKTGDPILKTGTFPTPIPVKARTKRSRTGSRVWSTGSTTTSSSSSNSCSNSCLIFNSTPQNLDLFYCLARPPVKKLKKKHVAANGGGVQRRCSHCGVQKTPQWRSGPMGAKTLCNACGVRYKSGRLLPEYRPACSPTFSSEVHSNSHRKVLEMRRKKEMIVGSEAVHSF